MATSDEETPVLGESAYGSVVRPEEQKRPFWRRYAPLLAIAAFIVIATAIVVPIAIVTKNRYAAVQGANGMVATEVAQCSEIGRDVLAEGGSAADAAIAAGLCIGVINNFASGIGGGGFMLVRDKSDRSDVFDFREEAPAAASRDMYADDLEMAKTGGMASGVPGEIRGYEAAHAAYGKLSWKRLFQPSIDLARNGFVVTALLAQRLTSIESLVKSDPLWAESYLVDGRLAQEGDTIYRRRLADTLQAVADGGADAFYTGSIAQTIIEDLTNMSGIMTLDDMANYSVNRRQPLVGFYRGMRVLTTPPPSSGPVLLFILNVLESYNLHEEGASPLSYQHIVEAMKFAYAQRSYLGDPEFVANMSTTLERMLSKEFAYEVRRNISSTMTHEPDYYGGEYEVEETPGTTHIAVLDKDGNLASLTSTVNLSWGSKLMSRTGVVMNNQMDDFSTPNTTNAYGLRASPANYIMPGKRPLSSSVPCAVFQDDVPRIVAGASGGSRIITGTLTTLINYLDFGHRVLEAVVAPRYHHQLYPNSLELEDGFSSAISEKLASYGHQINQLSKGATTSVVQAISRESDGYLYGASDPRKAGLAAGY